MKSGEIFFINVVCGFIVAVLAVLICFAVNLITDIWLTGNQVIGVFVLVTLSGFINGLFASFLMAVE